MGEIVGQVHARDGSPNKFSFIRESSLARLRRKIYGSRIRDIRGMCHGDLTTSNFIQSDSKYYIIDFGLSQMTDTDENRAVGPVTKYLLITSMGLVPNIFYKNVLVLRGCMQLSLTCQCLIHTYEYLKFRLWARVYGAFTSRHFYFTHSKLDIDETQMRNITDRGSGCTVMRCPADKIYHLEHKVFSKFTTRIAETSRIEIRSEYINGEHNRSNPYYLYGAICVIPGTSPF